MRAIYLLFGILLSCACAINASAQQVLPPLKHEYLDSALVALPSEKGAVYRRDIEQLDTVRGIVRTFFLDGRLFSVSEVEFRKEPIHNGTFESWYNNGQLSHHEEFEHGKRVGEMRLYYRNGQLKRRARYASAFESAGECFAADGQSMAFFEYEKLPVYPEGDGSNQAIVSAVQRGVKYPRDALKAGRVGRVLVSFNVTIAGKVSNIKVVQSVFPSLDAAVVQSVERLKPFTPGQQDGRPVSVAFTVPVTFAIQ